MNSRFVSAAEDEFSDAAIFYEEAEPGLGEDFILLVLEAVARLERFPELRPEIDNGIRSLVVSRFPFRPIYSVDRVEVLILAVAHQNRRPGYWLDRAID